MKKIYVTKPFLPPLDEFIQNLEDVWESGILTNYGPYHQKLEKALKNYLGIKNFNLLNNGTMALIATLEVLNIKGEVITTPYSFVATSHSLIWRNCKPVFVDINFSDCNIDPIRIVEAITERTTAILAVHCYGFPCDVDALENIAKKNNLRLIYDAAHAFGVKYKNKSILDYGDASILSFHATKIFSTIEGGGVSFRNIENNEKIRKLSNFGFENEDSVSSIGLNLKLNEIQAVMGLSQLTHIEEIFRKRKEIAERYDRELEEIEFIDFPSARINSEINNSYYPIFVRNINGRNRNGLYSFLRENGVYARKYFHPLINKFDAYKEIIGDHQLHMPVAERMAEEVLCLPIYPELSMDEQFYIIGLIKNFFSN